MIDSAGHLGTLTSSARFKDKIEPMNKESEAILTLKPVTFRYKKELDLKGIAQFGLVAEEVEKVNPDLVACDEQGKAYTVRYEAVNAMLLNEFLKEHPPQGGGTASNHCRSKGDDGAAAEGDCAFDDEFKGAGCADCGSKRASGDAKE